MTQRKEIQTDLIGEVVEFHDWFLQLPVLARIRAMHIDSEGDIAYTVVLLENVEPAVKLSSFRPQHGKAGAVHTVKDITIPDRTRMAERTKESIDRMAKKLQEKQG